MNEEIDISLFDSFLEEMKADYQNSSLQLRTALDKFAEQYQMAKSKSIPRLVSFLYDLNQNADPTSHVKSGSMIRVQVESVKRHKTESRGAKRKLPGTISEMKENLDPQVIPCRKKSKTGKKAHNLSENILKNKPN